MTFRLPHKHVVAFYAAFDNNIPTLPEKLQLCTSLKPRIML